MTVAHWIVKPEDRSLKERRNRRGASPSGATEFENRSGGRFQGLAPGGELSVGESVDPGTD